jgi:hypothetical protein
MQSRIRLLVARPCSMTHPRRNTGLTVQSSVGGMPGPDRQGPLPSGIPKPERADRSLNEQRSPEFSSLRFPASMIPLLYSQQPSPPVHSVQRLGSRTRTPGIAVLESSGVIAGFQGPVFVAVPVRLTRIGPS